MSLREAWVAWRNRRLADPRFQAAMARLPFGQAIARREARRLFDLGAGFVYAQIYQACVQLDLFALLARGARTSAEVALETGLAPPAAARLLRAAATLDLVEPVSTDRFALGPLGASFLGAPGVAEIVRHHEALYADLANPVALLKAGRGAGALSAYWPYARGGEADPARAGAYSALMAASQPMVAAQALAAYRFRRHRHLLDVGGGEGAFLAAVAKTAPALRLTLFDLPAVAERARARFAEAGLLDRAQVVEGSFLTDSLPPGADVVSLVRVLHDHDDPEAIKILCSAFAALPKGGVLVVCEPMAATPGAERAGDGYFGFYLLAMGAGRPRTAREIAGLAREAGFVRPRLAPTPLPLVARVLIAVRQD